MYEAGDFVVLSRQPPHDDIGAVVLSGQMRGRIRVVNEFGNASWIDPARIVEHWPNCPVAAGNKAHVAYLILTGKLFQK